MNTKKLIAVCILCLYLTVIPAIAQENDTTANETTVAVTPTIEPTAVPTVEATEAKFRVGPTVTLRPVNDVINKSQDGLVELYMYNPTVVQPERLQERLRCHLEPPGQSASTSRVRRPAHSLCTSQGSTGRVTIRTPSSRSH